MDDIRNDPLGGYDSITAAEALERLAELLDRAADGERVVITRGTERAVAIVPVDDVELLSKMEDAIDIEEARKALAEAEEKGTIPWEEIKARLGLG